LWPAAGKLIIDVTRSSLDKYVRYRTYRPHTAEGGDDVRVQKAPFEVPPGDTFKLRVFLDRSIIEIYGDDRQCVTQRIYPSRQDVLGVSLFCKGGLESLSLRWYTHFKHVEIKFPISYCIGAD
jgi:sucrose-6-phosphate hydrolase SacC (GH32 family)